MYKERLSGSQSINAAGLVVAPGFIDVHSHTTTLPGQQLNLLDGVTNQLDLEAGANIATETLSYAAGGTGISTGVFRRRDRQKMFDITCEDVQWVATG